MLVTSRPATDYYFHDQLIVLLAIISQSHECIFTSLFLSDQQYKPSNIFSSLSYRTKKRSKLSHLRSRNQTIFLYSACKMTDRLVVPVSTSCSHSCKIHFPSSYFSVCNCFLNFLKYKSHALLIQIWDLPAAVVSHLTAALCCIIHPSND